MSEWKTVRLGDYITEYSVKNKSNEDIPVYSVTNTQGFCTEYFSKDVSSKDKSNYKIVPRGCFAYNPSRINVGSVDWQRYEDRVIVSPLYNVFKVSPELENQYLYYFLKSDIGHTLITSKAEGSVRDNLKITMLAEFSIPLPPLEEQKHIAAMLDKCTALVTKYKLMLEKYDTLIKSRFIEMFGDIIQNTKNWELKSFTEIAKSRLGKMLDSKKQTGKEKYPYLANFNVQWFRFNLENLNEMDFSEADRIEFALKDGDLLVCEGGEVGRCAVWHNQIENCFFQKAVHRVRLNMDLVHPDYMAYWFKFRSDFNSFYDIVGSKATIAHLTGEKLKLLKIPVPPLALQNDFASFVQQIDKSKFAVQKSLEKAETLYKSLMQEYFA